VLLLLAATATGLGGMMRFVGVDVIIILTIPFCLVGLAVLHTIARRFSRPTVPLVGSLRPNQSLRLVATGGHFPGFARHFARASAAYSSASVYWRKE
jgi:hypothetical protein